MLTDVRMIFAHDRHRAVERPAEIRLVSRQVTELLEAMLAQQASCSSWYAAKLGRRIGDSSSHSSRRGPGGPFGSER